MAELIKGIVVGLYAMMIVTVGIIGLRKTRSFSDYFLGGGKIGPWMTAFTYGTAYFSAVLFVGFAGKVGWNFGFSGLWVAVGNALVGVLGVWLLVAPRVKRMSVEYGVATMGEFLEKRYGSPFLKAFAAVSIFLFFVPYSAAVFMGLSHLFKTSFGMSFECAVLSMGAFTALYLALGGYRSMAMIDVVFGMIMTVGVLVLVWSTVEKGGGLGVITEKLERINPQLTEFVGPPGWWPLFCLVFLTSVAPFGMPQLVQKFYAIRDQRAIRVGAGASTFFAILIGGAAYFTGSTIRVFLTPENTPAAFKGGAPRFDALMPEMLDNVVPETLSVVILLLILSASMSTLAALVLISSSSVVKDFYAGFVNRQATDGELTRLMRIASVLFVALSVMLALVLPATIVTILGISWGAIGSVFLGPFIWGLFTRRPNRLGAILSSVIGLAVCLGWFFIFRAGQGRYSPEAGTMGMIASLAIWPLFAFQGGKRVSG